MMTGYDDDNQVCRQEGCWEV